MPVTLFITICLTLTSCTDGGQPTGNAASPQTAAPASTAANSMQPSTAEPTTITPTTTPSASKPSESGSTPYAFPVSGTASYARSHHDYPATDLMAGCGIQALSPVNGAVLEVERVDRWNPKINAGATRGGLSVSILGDDGVRYYGSHYANIDTSVQPGTRVRAGQAIARVGKTGNASACHIHFGISPPCASTGDWWIRRGAVWPWPYLDSWRKGGSASPVQDVATWHTRHGCPAQPLTNP